MLLTHYERIFHRRPVDPHALDSSDEERLALKLDERLGRCPSCIAEPAPLPRHRHDDMEISHVIIILREPFPHLACKYMHGD